MQRNLLGIMEEARRRCWSAILFALLWPIPVYAFVGSLFIVINERVLGVHVLDASDLAGVSALGALLAAAAWSDAHDRADSDR